MSQIKSSKQISTETFANLKRFQAVIEQSTDGIVLLSKKGKLLYVSPAATRIFGYNFSDLNKLKSFTFIHPSDRKTVLKAFLVLGTQPNKPTNLTFRVKHKDGSYRWIEAVATNSLSNPDINALVINFRDISEKKQAVRRQELFNEINSLLASSLDYEKTIKKILDIVVEHFADYSRVMLIDQDKGTSDIRVMHRDKSKNELVKKLYESYINAPDPSHGVGKIVELGKSEHISIIDRKMLENIKPNKKLYRIVTTLGLKSYIGVPLKIRKKTIGAITFSSTQEDRIYTASDFAFAKELAYNIALAIDNARLYEEAKKELAERKRAEINIEKSEKRFRAIVEHSLDAFRLMDRKGKIFYASHSIQHILGYTLDEYLSLNIMDLVHPDDKKMYRHALLEVIKNPEIPYLLIYRIKHKNGSWRWMEGVGTNLLQDTNIKAIVANFRDITDRKQIEDVLHTERVRMQTLLANVPAVVLEAYGNPSGKVQRNDFVSKHAETMLGYTVDEWLSTPNFWLTIVHPADIERAGAEAREFYDSGKGGVSRFRWLRKDGTPIWVEAQSYVIFDEKGIPIGMRGVTIDITERMEVEQRKNEFISMASHELKTPVTSIKLFIEVLTKHLLDSADGKTTKILYRLADQADKLHELISDLLDVSRIQLGKLQFTYETFNIIDLIANTIDDIQHSSDRHKLSFIHNGPLQIHGDKFRLYQVITNLLTNAIKYSPKGGEVIVRVKRNSHKVVISVQDQGIGISKKDQVKVFERLYQAKSAKERTFPGLGMGLYISQEIISRHNGKIWVESDHGKGSTFYISLPFFIN